MRTFHLMAVAAAAAVLVGASSPAAAEESRRVVVAEFQGPEPASRQVHEAVVRIVGDFYEVIPASKYRVTRRRMEIADDSMKSVALVAQKVGADAIVEGQLNGRTLTLAVRAGKTGRVIDRFNIPVQGGRGISDAAREQLLDELVDLIDWTEPLHGNKEDDLPGDADPSDQDDRGGERGREAPRASFATDTKPAPAAAPPVVPAAPAATPPADGAVQAEVDPSKPKADARPSPILVQTAVGASAAARQLRFSRRADLEDPLRPVDLSGSPSPAIVLAGMFELIPLGVSADVSYMRTVGSSMTINVSGQPKQLSTVLSQLGGGLSFQRKTTKRITLRGGVGYRQVSFTIANRPPALRLSDVRYAFLDASGGARLALRDDRLALTGELRYLHVLGSSGITDKAVFGTAHIQGYGAEIGFEIQTTDSTFVRLAGNYERLTLAFNGDGEWSKNQETGFKDVSGAADTFIDFAVLLGFRL